MSLSGQHHAEMPTASLGPESSAGAHSSRTCLVAVGSDLIEQLGFHPAPRDGDAADEARRGRQLEAQLPRGDRAPRPRTVLTQGLSRSVSSDHDDRADARRKPARRLRPLPRAHAKHRAAASPSPTTWSRLMGADGATSSSACGAARRVRARPAAEPRPGTDRTRASMAEARTHDGRPEAARQRPLLPRNSARRQRPTATTLRLASGGAAPRLFAKAVLAANADTERTVWLADSFAGTTQPATLTQDAEFDYFSKQEILTAPYQRVRDAFEWHGLLDDRVRFLRRLVQGHAPATRDRRVAVLRFDGDLYESTMDTLRPLYPKVAARRVRNRGRLRDRRGMQGRGRRVPRAA